MKYYSKSLLAFLVTILAFLPIKARAFQLDANFQPDEYDTFYLIGKHYSYDFNSMKAQTFTVEASGYLEEVHVPLYKSAASNNPPNLFMNILTTSAGAPTANSLGSTSIPFADWQDNELLWRVFDLSAYNVMVTAGDLLAIALSLDNPNRVVWAGRDHESGTIPIYDGGEPFISNDGDPWSSLGTIRDFAFRTYVNPSAPIPEPSTVILLGLGFGLFGLTAYRKKNKSS